jgi:hypothetical protein
VQPVKAVQAVQAPAAGKVAIGQTPHVDPVTAVVVQVYDLWGELNKQEGTVAQSTQALETKLYPSAQTLHVDPIVAAAAPQAVYQIQFVIALPKQAEAPEATVADVQYTVADVAAFVKAAAGQTVHTLLAK